VANVRPSGYNMMNLVDDDELVSVRPAGPRDNIILVSRNGQALHFKQEEVRLFMNRGGMGVKGMNLIADDRVVSMDVGPSSASMLVVSKLGFGKITSLNSYRKKGRAGKGVRTLKITDKTGPVADARVIDGSEEVYVVSEQAQVLRTSLSEISNLGRDTQGVTIFKPAEGDAVASISCVSDLNLRDDDPKPANSGKKLKVKQPTTNGSRNGRANGAQPSLEGLN
jgi:DNA gyrase subunit A